MIDAILNDGLLVKYVLDGLTITRTMNQMELATLLLEDDVFLLSVNEQKSVHIRKKKKK